MGTYHSDSQAPIKKTVPNIFRVSRRISDGYQKIKDLITVNKSQISIFLKQKKREKTN